MPTTTTLTQTDFIPLFQQLANEAGLNAENVQTFQTIVNLLQSKEFEEPDWDLNLNDFKNYSSTEHVGLWLGRFLHYLQQF